MRRLQRSLLAASSIAAVAWTDSGSPGVGDLSESKSQRSGKKMSAQGAPLLIANATELKAQLGR